jgi:hypothetical protein
VSEGFSKLHALSAVRDDRTLSKAERLVLVMLISHAKHDTGECFPSLDLLADECDMARSVVAAAVSSLRARGAASPVRVTVVRRARVEGRGRESNVYRLDLSPAGGLKSRDQSTAAGLRSGDLSPKIGRPKSEKGPDLSPAGGLEAGKEAGQEAGKRSAPTSGAGSFTLEAPTPKAKSTPRKRPQNGNRSGVPDPRVSLLWDHHHAEYERLRGVKPIFTESQRGAAGRAWKEMLAALDGAPAVGKDRAAEEGRQIITAALVEGFHVKPSAIVANMNNFRGTGRPRGRGLVDVQPGDVRPEVEAAARARGEALAGE